MTLKLELSIHLFCHLDGHLSVFAGRLWWQKFPRCSFFFLVLSSMAEDPLNGLWWHWCLLRRQKSTASVSSFSHLCICVFVCVFVCLIGDSLSLDVCRVFADTYRVSKNSLTHSAYSLWTSHVRQVLMVVSFAFLLLFFATRKDIHYTLHTTHALTWMANAFSSKSLCFFLSLSFSLEVTCRWQSQWCMMHSIEVRDSDLCICLQG